MIKPVYLEAKTIEEAFYRCVGKVLDVGRRNKVQHGSTGTVGKIRIEFDYINIFIEYPDPSTALPNVQSAFGLPNPVEPDYWDKMYKRYIMTSERQKDEAYTYGQRLWAGDKLKDSRMRNEEGCLFSIDPVDQVTHLMTVLAETPNTNQAVLQIAQPSDTLIKDPPCLRQIGLRVLDDQLHFFINFRSWDLWGGFPANLQGLAHLQKFMADNIGMETGQFICESKGLHLYLDDETEGKPSIDMEKDIYEVIAKMFREQ